jgi:hypothetical protein
MLSILGGHTFGPFGSGGTRSWLAWIRPLPRGADTTLVRAARTARVRSRGRAPVRCPGSSRIAFNDVRGAAMVVGATSGPRRADGVWLGWW